VAVIPLFRGRVVVPVHRRAQGHRGLELDGKRATWRFGKESDEESRLQLGLVYLDDGHIKYLDGNDDTDLDIDVKGSAGEGGSSRPRQGPLPRGAHHRDRHDPEPQPAARGAARAQGKATVGRTRAEAQGSLATDGRSLDLKTRLAGQTLKDFGAITGIVFPDTPPYDVSGQLRHAGSDWVFDPVRGEDGRQRPRRQRDLLEARAEAALHRPLHFQVLDFDDLGPLIGAPPKTAPARPRRPSSAQGRPARGRGSPAARPEIQHRGLGQDGRRRAARALKVQRPKQLPIDKLSAHLVLKDSVLALEPLNFGIARGASPPTSRSTPTRSRRAATIKADVQGLKLAPLFPTAKSMQEASARSMARWRSPATAPRWPSCWDRRRQGEPRGGRRAHQRAAGGADRPRRRRGSPRARPKHTQVQLRCAVSGFDVKAAWRRPIRSWSTPTTR
jgi:hypothetical protein